MSTEAHATLRDLLLHRSTASLGTLHSGEPAVSMVPFALLRDGSGVVVHVSRLASHTSDMLRSSRVSLMIAAEERNDVPPQALPRITIKADAMQLSGEEAELARDDYLARFPDAAPIFDLPDFLLFALKPISVRVVSGFGSAETLTAADFAAAAAR